MEIDEQITSGKYKDLSETDRKLCTIQTVRRSTNLTETL